MPEGTESLLSSLFIRKPAKSIRSAVIKQSCGIGDTDGFPAFDSESDSYAVEDDPLWGFRITGGADFRMPLTVFQVKPGSIASSEGICLGDIILSINDIDASHMTLAKAHEIINTEQKLFIVAKSMEDEDVPESERKPCEEKGIVMRLPQPMKMPSPPREYIPVKLVERKPWHPVMWPEPIKVPGEENPEAEAPHCRIVRNIRRFFTENAENSEMKRKQLEETYQHRQSKIPIQEKIRSMQRKLSEIAEIPKILSSTLQTVSRTFEHMLPAASDDDLKLPYIESEDDIENDNIDKESGTQNDLSTEDDDENELSEIDSLNESDNKRFKQNDKQLKDITPESDYVSDNETEDEYDDFLAKMPKLVSEDEMPNHTDVSPEEDLFKKKKQEKISKMEKSWPWADQPKIIYKASTCHLVPKLSIVQSRIQQLGEKNIMAFYEKNRKDSV